MPDAKPFHEMTLGEYLLTSDAQRIPKHSIAGLHPAEYSAARLSPFHAKDLEALALLWGVARTGRKDDLINRIIRRKEFRERLASHTIESLSCLSRKELAAMAKEAGLFHSALTKEAIRTALLSWRKAERIRAARQLGEVRHFQRVRRALIQGLRVPAENRERYGLDENGRIERHIYGIPVSTAIRRAPEAITAARDLSQGAFAAWVQNHSKESEKANLVVPGLISSPAQFWAAVQKAFAPDLQGTLFPLT